MHHRAKMEGCACDLSFVCASQEQKAIPVRTRSCKTRLPLKAGALLLPHGPYPSRLPSRPSLERCRSHQRLALWLRWLSPLSRSLLLDYLSKCNHSKCFVFIFAFQEAQYIGFIKYCSLQMFSYSHTWNLSLIFKEHFILTLRLKWLLVSQTFSPV